MKNSKPKLNLIGVNGNIFNIVAQASKVLKKNKMKDKVEELQNRIESAKNYDEAMLIVAEYVDITG